MSQSTTAPVPAGIGPTNHILAVLIGIDITLNALLGGRSYQTLSSRIGESLRTGGWAAKVPWPAWFARHCLAADYSTEI